VAQTEAEPPSASETGRTPTGRPGQMRRGLERPLLSWPRALAAILATVAVLLAGGALLLRQITAQRPVPVTVAPTSLTTSEPTLSVQPTSPPQTLAAASNPTTVSNVATVAATSRPTPVPTPMPSPVPTQAVAASGSVTAEPSPLPTVPPELRSEVEAAYTQYWDARAQAVWTLDPSPLDAVATGDELLALRNDVEQLRTEGHAIKAEVQHQYTVVAVDGDQAQVADRLRDFSIYVDASTKEPLPGQVRPDEASAPLSTSLYFLRRVDDAWKVERGEAHANN
jgi:hypothetical protein